MVIVLVAVHLGESYNYFQMSAIKIQFGSDIKLQFLASECPYASYSLSFFLDPYRFLLTIVYRDVWIGKL